MKLHQLHKPELKLWLPWLMLWLALLIVTQQQFWPLWRERQRLSVSLTNLQAQTVAGADAFERGENMLLDPQTEPRVDAYVNDHMKIISVETLDTATLLNNLEELAAMTTVRLEAVELPVALEIVKEVPQLSSMMVKLQAVGGFHTLKDWLTLLEDAWPSSNIASWQLQRRHNTSDLALTVEIQIWGREAERYAESANVSNHTATEFTERNDPFQTPY